MEVIRDIAAVLGLLVTIGGIIASLTKRGRALLHKIKMTITGQLIEENKQQSEDILHIKDSLSTLTERFDSVEAVCQQRCRDKIKEIYYKYCNVKQIPLYERKTADVNWEIYRTRFHGNSYAALLYQQITQWEVIPSGNIEIEEN